MFLVNLRKFVYYFAQNKKREIIVYLIISYFASILEVFGVAVVYPFILLILKPELLDKLPFHISPFFIGIGIILLFIFKNIYMIHCIKIQGKLVKNIETDIMQFFMNFFLYAPYNITSGISRTEKERVITILPLESVNNFFLRFLNLNINLAIVLSILLLLFIKFPVPTLITGVFAIITISVQNYLSKRLLKRASDDLWAAQKDYDTLKGAIMPNFKLIKLNNTENILGSKVNVALNKLKIAQAEYFTSTTKQPYVLEPLVLILLFVMLVSIACVTKNDRNVLIASFAIAASAIFRILPSLARVQTSINGIVFGRKYVKELISFYEKYCQKAQYSKNNIEQIEFKDKVLLDNISFEYQKNKPIIKNLSLTIEKNKFIGIIGESGAGKTTLIDIISGLLPVSTGSISVDNKVLNNMADMRSLIGYVPQEPVFFNTSFRENIAFGCECIDDERVIQVLKQAAIYDFIEKNYKDGINAVPMVDTNGLSLGQKQRLSIARALYKNPQILILDEATSALDLETEKEICTLLNTLKKNMTIIAIAHRLSTLVSCDKLVFLKEGEIIAEGSFKDLEDNCSEFQKLLKIQRLNNTLF